MEAALPLVEVDWSWQEEAACRAMDPELFFPTRGAPTREAKEVCFACPVRLECLDAALAGRERFGIWGGLSERERRRLRRRIAGQRQSDPWSREPGDVTLGA